MGIRERIEYVIEYYGFMILALFLMAIVGITLVAGISGDEKNKGMSVALVNQYYTEEALLIWESAFKKAYGEQPVEFDSSYQVDLEGFADDTTQGYLMKLSANLFAGEIDMMILDEKSYAHFLKLGALRDLRPILREVLSEEEIGMIQAGEENAKETFGLILPPDFSMAPGEKTYLVIPSSGSGTYSYPELFRAIYAF